MQRMTAEQYKRQNAGARARVAGQTFEDQIAASLTWHEERGILKAAKTPEPMKPIGKRQAGGRFTAVYTKAAQVDFSGTMRGGRSVRFEAKQTESDRFERKRLTDEQMDDLRGHEKLGALCFVILCFGFDHFYRVPWKVWDHMRQIFGRQYVKEDDLQRYRIPYVAGVIKIMSGDLEPETELGRWIPENDGWFDFFRCSKCGGKQLEPSEKCPACKAPMEMEVAP